MHPGFVVYSVETILKLRAIAGDSVGCNYDQSHMFWQGIAAIRVWADAIFRGHAKDTQIYEGQPSEDRRSGYEEVSGRKEPQMDFQDSWIRLSGRLLERFGGLTLRFHVFAGLF
jgi:sugar phosphate isomerase/epimerase